MCRNLQLADGKIDFKSNVTTKKPNEFLLRAFSVYLGDYAVKNRRETIGSVHLVFCCAHVEFGEVMAAKELKMHFRTVY